MHQARRPALLTLALVVLMVLLAGLTSTPSAAGSSGAPSAASSARSSADQPHVLVLGDSITSKSYYSRDVYGKGWWAHLVEDTDAYLIMSAESGSGFVRQGLHCAGTTFGERLAAMDLSRADYVVVEGGVNDLFRCTGRDTMVWTKGRDLRSRIPAFMDQLAAAADQAGLPRDHLYVFTPWGTEWRPQRARITKVVRRQAQRIGAEYVDVPAFPARLTRDGIHPTRKGSRFLYRKLVRGSTLLDRITAAG